MGKSESVRVCIRFRPFNERELSTNFDIENLTIEFLNKNRTVHVVTKDGLVDKNYNFDYVFETDVTQDEFYNVCAKPVMEEVLKGYNGTIFAYGQTGSGKTWSMMGPTDERKKIRELRGLIPRTGEHVFDFIKKGSSNQEFKISVSYLEIYRETIQDLLDVTKTKLKIHESPTRGIYVKDLTHVYIRSLEDIYYYTRLGDHNKSMAATEMNKSSSRSHSVFTIRIAKTDKMTGTTVSGKINLVDLAGSEKVRKSGAEGDRLKEAMGINKSLSALGHCINCIVENKPHIPYRNSKLTRILQESLGGNSKTTIVCACSPHPFNLDETISTLGFGARAKSIKLKVKQNIRRSAEELQKMVDALERQIKKEKIKNKKLMQELAKYRDLTPEEKADLMKLQKVKEKEEEPSSVNGLPNVSSGDDIEDLSMSELQQELNVLKEKYEIEVNSVKKEIEEEKKMSEEFEKKFQEREKIIQEKRIENEKLKRKEGMYEAYKKEFNRKLKFEQEQIDQEKNVFIRENEELSNKIQKLKEKNAQIEKDMKELTDEKKKKERSTFLSQIESYQNQYNELKAEGEKLQKEVEEQEKKKIELRKDLQSKKQMYDRYFNENKLCVEQIDELEQRMREFNKDIAETEEELELIMQENEVFEENAKRLEEENQKQVEKLRAKNVLLQKMKMLMKRYNINLNELKQIKLKITIEDDVIEDSELKGLENAAVMEIGGKLTEEDLSNAKEIVEPDTQAPEDGGVQSQFGLPKKKVKSNVFSAGKIDVGVDENGTTIVSTEDGKKFSVNKDGKAFFTDETGFSQEMGLSFAGTGVRVAVDKKDGTTLVKMPNGTNLQLLKDGNVVVKSKTGHQQTFTPLTFTNENIKPFTDNVFFVQKDEKTGNNKIVTGAGETLILNNDGSTKVIEKDGKETLVKDYELPKFVQFDVDQNTGMGTFQFSNPDDQSKVMIRGGTALVETKDGKRVVSAPVKGKSSIKSHLFEGIALDVQEEKGNVSFQTADRCKVDTFNDGKTIVTGPNGEKVEFNMKRGENIPEKPIGKMKIDYNPETGETVFTTGRGSKVFFEKSGKSRILRVNGEIKNLITEPVEEKVFVQKSLLRDMKEVENLRRSNQEMVERKEEMTRIIITEKKKTEEIEREEKNKINKLRNEYESHTLEHAELEKVIENLKVEVQQEKKKREEEAITENKKIQEVQKQIEQRNDAIKTLEAQLDLKSQSFKEYKKRMDEKIENIEKERKEFLIKKEKYIQTTVNDNKKQSAGGNLKTLVNELFTLRLKYKTTQTERDRLLRECNLQRRQMAETKKNLRISEKLCGLRNERIMEAEKEVKRARNSQNNKRLKKAEKDIEEKETILRRIAELQEKIKKKSDLEKFKTMKTSKEKERGDYNMIYTPIGSRESYIPPQNTIYTPLTGQNI